MRGQVKDALRSLIKKGVVIVKPTSYGNEVSLNPRAPDIEVLMEKSVEVAKEMQKQKMKKKSRGVEI